METKLWILASVGTMLLGTSGYFLKMAVNLVVSRLDKIVAELQLLQVSRATTTQDINRLQEQVADHENRIRKVEYGELTEKF